MYNWVEILIHILMYIFFINSSGRYDIFFFLLNLIIIVIKKKNLSNSRVQPDPTQPMWVRLGWVEFFLTHHGGLGQKLSLSRPNLTHAHPYLNWFINKCFKDVY